MVEDRLLTNETLLDLWKTWRLTDCKSEDDAGALAVIRLKQVAKAQDAKTASIIRAERLDRPGLRKLLMDLVTNPPCEDCGHWDKQRRWCIHLVRDCTGIYERCKLVSQILALSISFPEAKPDRPKLREKNITKVGTALLEFAKWYEHCAVKNNKLVLGINLKKSAEELLDTILALFDALDDREADLLEAKREERERICCFLDDYNDLDYWSFCDKYGLDTKTTINKKLSEVLDQTLKGGQ